MPDSLDRNEIIITLFKHISNNYETYWLNKEVDQYKYIVPLVIGKVVEFDINLYINEGNKIWIEIRYWHIKGRNEFGTIEVDRNTILEISVIKDLNDPECINILDTLCKISVEAATIPELKLKLSPYSQKEESWKLLNYPL